MFRVRHPYPLTSIEHSRCYTIFGIARALEAFNKVIQADPQCAMAYWGAAMTYNHPFWDAPTPEDESAAWALVQKGMQATKKTPREKMYLDAVAALYKNGRRRVEIRAR